MSDGNLIEPPKLDFVLEGKPGTIAVASFVSALQNASGILIGVDTALTRRRQPTVEWYVQDLRIGSLQTTLIAKPRHGKGALEYSRVRADEIASAVVDGLGEVEGTAIVPDLFSDKSMRHLQRLGSLLKKNGAIGFRVIKPDDQREARVTPRVAQNAKQALMPRYAAQGAVIGRLDVINVHTAQQFTVYDEIHRRPVRGTFAPELIDVVKDALSKRVLATGIIRRNAANQMVSIDVVEIEILPDDATLPTVAQLVGSDPDFTGGLPSDEWVRKTREA